jgi:hypothetical protein
MARSTSTWLALAVALTGCRQILGLDDLPPGDGGGDDDGAPTDGRASFDGGSCAWAQQPQSFDPCAIGTPGATVVLATGTYTFDTTSGVLRDPSGASVPIVTTTVAQAGATAIVWNVVAFHLELGCTLRAIGSAPLIIASWDTITVDGTLDVASRAGSLGAGANAPACATATPGTGDAGGAGSGGGGGGGFQGRGGNGGEGDNDTPNPGGPGGAATALPTFPRGGCLGAPSGQAGPAAVAPSTATTVSAGGAGGGAIQLSAQRSIRVAGSVGAGGQGGGGSPGGSACGGGGGGSGGYIGFEAPQIALEGTIAANGGGGGGSAPFASAGAAGQDGMTSDTAAAGGAASSCSDLAPSGSAGAIINGPNADNVEVACGGGGGGGAAGYIVTRGSVSGTPIMISPLPTSP